MAEPLSYEDFEVELAESGGGYVRAVRSPAGEVREPLGGSSDELGRLGANLETARLIGGPLPIRPLGAALFEALMGGGQARGLYEVSQKLMEQAGKGLRIKLRVQPAGLAALPWELMYDEHQARQVALSAKTPVVRYLEVPRQVLPLAVKPPLRVLGMIASPSDLPAIDAKQEKTTLETATALLVERGLLELHWIEGSAVHLQRAMSSDRWHVVHFIGHGTFDPARQTGVLMLTGLDGTCHRLEAGQLAPLLADQETLRLVVLNACAGAVSGRGDAFGSLAAALVRAGVPAVVAMQDAIPDEAAVHFSRAFYGSLLGGAPVDAAVCEGRKRLSVQPQGADIWWVPTLFMRARDGILFQIEGGLSREERAPVGPRITVIAVMGVKGGVGKGMITSCMAQLFAEAGHQVAVLDFDLETCGTTLAAKQAYGVSPAAVRTAYDHIAPHSIGFDRHRAPSADDLLDMTPGYLRERGLGRIWLLPASDPERYKRKWEVVANVPYPREKLLLSRTYEMIARAANVQPSLRVVLIDCGAGTNPIFSAAFAAADYGFIVTPPDRAFFGELEMIRAEHSERYPEHRQTRIATIVNQVTSKGDQERAEVLNPAGFVPRDPQLQEHQFQAGAIDFDLGFDAVSIAVRRCLRTTLRGDDVPLLPGSFDRIRPWWRHLVEGGLAARILNSAAFRLRTAGTRLGVAALAAAFAAASITNIRAASNPEAARIPGLIQLALLGALAWLVRELVRHEQRRRILGRVAGLRAEGGVEDRRVLEQLMDQPDRPALRWLLGLVRAAQQKQTERYGSSGGAP